jgi:hypothetical protein
VPFWQKKNWGRFGKIIFILKNNGGLFGLKKNGGILVKKKPGRFDMYSIFVTQSQYDHRRNYTRSPDCTYCIENKLLILKLC